MNVKSSSLVSVVVLAESYGADDFQVNIQHLSDYLHNSYEDYELIIVADAVCSLRFDLVLNSTPCVRVLEVPFVTDKDSLLSLGLDCAIGDFVVLFNPTTDPVELISSAVTEGEEGNDIVIGQDSNMRRGLFYTLMRPVASLILKEVGVRRPRNATDFHCLSRQAVNLVTQNSSHSHQLFVRISCCGLGVKIVPYRANQHAPKNFFEGVEELLELLVFNTTRPLRWMSFIGLLGSVFSLLFSGYTFVNKFFDKDIADGWSSLVILMSFFSMITFMILALFGEYMNRLLNEKSTAGKHWAVRELNSTVTIQEERHNTVYIQGAGNE
jgi:hypothetical protein